MPHVSAAGLNNTLPNVNVNNIYDGSISGIALNNVGSNINFNNINPNCNSSNYSFNNNNNSINTNSSDFVNKSNVITQDLISVLPDISNLDQHKANQLNRDISCVVKVGIKDIPASSDISAAVNPLIPMHATIQPIQPIQSAIQPIQPIQPISPILPQYNVNMNQVGGLQPATILSEPYYTCAHPYGVIPQQWTDANANIF